MDAFLSLFGKDITFFGAICSLLGIIGTILGIINACIAISNEKIKIKLSLGFSYVINNIQVTCTDPFHLLNEDIFNAAKLGLVIYPKFKIVNKSKYDLFIEDFGLTNSKLKKESACFIKDMTNMPKEIKAFSSVNIPCMNYSIFNIGDNWKYAYITLSTGKTVFRRLPHYRKTVSYIKNGY